MNYVITTIFVLLIVMTISMIYHSIQYWRKYNSMSASGQAIERHNSIAVQLMIVSVFLVTLLALLQILSGM